MHRARNEAARAGLLLASGLIALGMATVLGGWIDTGLWLAFLGWFLASAARQELAADQALHVLTGITVASVMSPNPMTVPPTLSLGALVSDVLPRVHGSTIPVVSDGALLGLITPDHLRSVPPSRWWDQPVIAAATPAAEVATATPPELLTDLLERMDGALKRVVVLDRGGRVVGVISPTDISRTVQNAALRDLALHPDRPLNRR